MQDPQQDRDENGQASQDEPDAPAERNLRRQDEVDNRQPGVAGAVDLFRRPDAAQECQREPEQWQEGGQFFEGIGAGLAGGRLHG